MVGVVFGGVLLSHTLAGAVPSALEGLASGFGMGPGVSRSAVAAVTFGVVVVGVVVGWVGRALGAAQWTRVLCLGGKSSAY